MPSKAIASNKVVINGDVIPATIIYSTHSGKILAVYEHEVVCSIRDPRLERLDVESYEIVSPHVIMPGLVDSHVHLNEPGRTEWEGFATGTRAAASGGVTTVVDMPLNAIPPTTTVENLDIKLAAAQGQMWCDVAFWGGLVPSNLDQLVPLVKRGVRGFKGFTMESGVDEFPEIDNHYIMKALAALKDQKTMLLFHAEQRPSDDHHGVIDIIGSGLELDQFKTLDGGKDLSEVQAHALAESKILASVEPTTGQPAHAVYDHNSTETPLKSLARTNDQNFDNIDPTAYAPYLASRPDVFETNAIGMIISCLSESAKRFNTVPNVHIAHLATQEALPMLHYAQTKLGLPISAETCFHYLSFAAESIPAKATYFKCCPPIRSEANRLGLWKSLRDNIVGTVVSDHSPCTPELKDLAKGDFLSAWGGIASVGLGLSILITEGAKMSPPVSITEIVTWCCENTAKQVGLQHSKGYLRAGHDADFIVLDQYSKRVISNRDLLFKNKLSAYAGRELRGQVISTFLRGKLAYEMESGPSAKPLGQTLLEERTV
ncbi:LANO_0B07998g1_1 [Lachancea nothofagi CBS 11611]|uniref:LANO_0B07998g1_1 n=1 Tax=Lachancea nothofagi CBS 11611 TaxID=1266666 RepID=A0A1G4J0J8_9SACH|nr:LANO_0B07998g1_1 [Lachancea nothofagi CBS 11611]